MPALTIPSPSNDLSTSSPSTSAPSDTPDSQNYHVQNRSESSSPERPPVSPITPTVALAQLAPIGRSDPKRTPPLPSTTFIQQPPSVPISESENSDAIALRSAISLLQLQREKSQRDLKSLEELKQMAVSDPVGFMRAVQEQRKSKSGSNVLGPTLSDMTKTAHEESNDSGHGRRTDSERKDSVDVGGNTSSSGGNKFPPVPQPQNIVRCPPVNWAKYQIVGEPLDKLHEEQSMYPGSGDSVPKAKPHSIAAPYSPFTDRIGDANATQSRRASKKPPT